MSKGPHLLKGNSKKKPYTLLVFTELVPNNKTSSNLGQRPRKAIAVDTSTETPSNRALHKCQNHQEDIIGDVQQTVNILNAMFEQLTGRTIVHPTKG